MKAENISYIIGIDEVGRGPLAGPVLVCALAIAKNFKIEKIIEEKLPLKDSKKLTKNQRQAWNKKITSLKKEGKIFFITTNCSHDIIDKINISKATNKAVLTAVKKLLKQLPLNSNIEIFLDGGLKINPTKLDFKNFKIKKIETIIKGDEKIPVISLASIIAKEKRDSLMKKNHKIFCHYNFEKNSGYGTKEHIRAIKKFGLCKIHRKSFIKKLLHKKEKPPKGFIRKDEYMKLLF